MTILSQDVYGLEVFRSWDQDIELFSVELQATENGTTVGVGEGMVPTTRSIGHLVQFLKVSSATEERRRRRRRRRKEKNGELVKQGDPVNSLQLE